MAMEIFGNLALFPTESANDSLVTNLSGSADSSFPRTADSQPADSAAGDEWIFAGLTSAVLGVLILSTIVGNVFVIAAILLERHLHSVANYLIVSLAVADLLVACLVMPLGAVYEISQKWILGPELCDMWTSSDVLCCTASILHLVAIAVDRYWAVTNVEYIQNRNSKRISVMIFLVWSVALLVSLGPLFGWKDPEFIHRVNVQQRCLISQDVAYQVFATCATFYVPLTVILILYWKIFQTARRRIRRKPGASTETKEKKSWFRVGRFAQSGAQRQQGQQATTAFTIGVPHEKICKSPNLSDALAAPVPENQAPSPCRLTPSSSTRTSRKRRETLESKREKKAAKTLAIITGAFVVCWLPFFVCALLMPLCPDYHFNDTMLSFFLWLGYFNSTLNPIIYTIFSPEFRQAFKRLLCGRPAVRARQHH